MSPMIVLIPLALIEFVAIVLYMRKGPFTQEKRVKLAVIVLGLCILDVLVGLFSVVLLLRISHA